MRVGEAVRYRDLRTKHGRCFASSPRNRRAGGEPRLGAFAHRGRAPGDRGLGASRRAASPPWRPGLGWGHAKLCGGSRPKATAHRPGRRQARATTKATTTTGRVCWVSATSTVTSAPRGFAAGRRPSARSPHLAKPPATAGGRPHQSRDEGRTHVQWVASRAGAPPRAAAGGQPTRRGSRQDRCAQGKSEGAVRWNRSVVSAPGPLAPPEFAGDPGGAARPWRA